MNVSLISFAIVLGIASQVHSFAPSKFNSRSIYQQIRSSTFERSAPLQVTSSDRISDSAKKRRTKNSSSAKKSNTSKKPHDRTIDRRKSPALWRYDLEYSIAPAGRDLAQQTSKTDIYIPKAPPELMSPAGGWPQLKAAVANGADAVYLGLTSYSARARAANFDPDPSLLQDSDDDDYEPEEDKPASLAHAVRFAHKYNVRVYVAFNTLVFDEELHEVQDLIEKVWDCGVDAVIIQDMGVAKIVKEVVTRLSKSGAGKGLNGAPLEIHASTQQTVTCADGVSFAAERTNATRVVSALAILLMCQWYYSQPHTLWKRLNDNRFLEES